jgi:regulator of replication initiation timing
MGISQSPTESIVENTFDDKFEAVREQFIHELSLLPSRLIALQNELKRTNELRRTNQLLSQENGELCSDIQDLITENRDLILENQRCTKVVHSQQQKIQELEEDFERILLAQDDLFNHEEKRLDTEFKLKYKVHAGALERAQLLSAVHKLEEERDNMAEKINILMEENRRLNRLSGKFMVGNNNDDHAAVKPTMIMPSQDEESPRTRRSSFIQFPLFHRLAPRLHTVETDERKRATVGTKDSLTPEETLNFSTDVTRNEGRNHRRRSENDLKEENKQNSFLDWNLSEKRLPRAKSLLMHPYLDNDHLKQILDVLETHSAVVDDNDLSYGLTESSSQNSINGESRPNDNHDNFQGEGSLLVEFGCDKSIDTDSGLNFWIREH